MLLSSCWVDQCYFISVVRLFVSLAAVWIWLSTVYTLLVFDSHQLYCKYREFCLFFPAVSIKLSQKIANFSLTPLNVFKKLSKNVGALTINRLRFGLLEGFISVRCMKADKNSPLINSSLKKYTRFQVILLKFFIKYG